MSILVTKEAFETAVYSEFLMVLDGVLPVKLILVQFELSSQSLIHECFTLLFQAPADAPNEQQLRQLQHATLGEMDIFLVPVRKNASGLVYEAVFNRLLK